MYTIKYYIAHIYIYGIYKMRVYYGVRKFEVENVKKEIAMSYNTCTSYRKREPLLRFSSLEGDQSADLDFGRIIRFDYSSNGEPF